MTNRLEGGNMKSILVTVMVTVMVIPSSCRMPVYRTRRRVANLKARLLRRLLGASLLGPPSLPGDALPPNLAYPCRSVTGCFRLCCGTGPDASDGVSKESIET